MDKNAVTFVKENKGNFLCPNYQLSVYSISDYIFKYK